MRILQTVLALAVCAAAASVSGCFRRAPLMATPGEADEPKPAKPAPLSARGSVGSQLWRIEVLENGKIMSRLDICADQRAGVWPPEPGVAKGQGAQDFNVEMRRSDTSLKRVRHYRLLGTCPTGWGASDPLTPGARVLPNALSGSACMTQASSP